MSADYAPAKGDRVKVVLTSGTVITGQIAFTLATPGYFALAGMEGEPMIVGVNVASVTPLANEASVTYGDRGDVR